MKFVEKLGDRVTYVRSAVHNRRCNEYPPCACVTIVPNMLCRGGRERRQRCTTGRCTDFRELRWWGYPTLRDCPIPSCVMQKRVDEKERRTGEKLIESFRLEFNESLVIMWGSESLFIIRRLEKFSNNEIFFKVFVKIFNDLLSLWQQKILQQ